MTTDHLDDDALSAAVDGDATAAEAAHLQSCSQCRARQATLAAVARAVSAPVSRRSPEAVDDALARAMAAWSPDETEEVVSRAGIVPPPAIQSQPLDMHRAAARRGSPRWLPAAAGIAAAVVIVGGVVAITRGRSPSRSTTAALAPSSTVATPAPSVTTGVDLGSQSDPMVVARLVDGALSNQSSPGAASSASALGGASSSVVPSAAQNLVPPSTACATQARSAVGLSAAPAGSTTLRYVASVRWLGQSGVVVVFSRPGGLAGAVMKTADCSVLAILPL